MFLIKAMVCTGTYTCNAIIGQGLGRSNSFKNSLVFILQLFSFTICFAQQDAYISPAGTKFLLYTPPGYHSSATTFPLLLSLHSKGEVGDDLTELTSKNTEQMPSRLIYLNRWPKDFPFIVLTPQLRPEKGDPDPKWGPQWPTEYIDEVVRYVTANFRVDPGRIYVTGISKGGIGAWRYASAYPEKVTALIPLSGRSDLTWACTIKNIPIWAFHGDGDGLVTPAYSIDMVNAIKACQPPAIYKPRLNIIHARNHNGWNEVYNGSSGHKVYEWLLMFRKNDTSNKKPYVNAGMDQRIALRSQTLHIIGDFFDSDGNIVDIAWKQTAGTALTLNNTNSEFLKISNLKTGLFEFELAVSDNNGARSSDKVLLEIVPASTTPAVTGLILMNGKTNTEIANLSEGQIINKTALGITEINIKAIASGGTGSVRFSVNTDQHTRTLNSPGPYFIKSQTTGPEWKIENGEYLICATPFTQTGARGARGISQCFKVTVTAGTGVGTCPGAGKITREVWNNITGTSVSYIPVNSPPSSSSELTIFEGPLNVGSNYGARVRGYICPPTTGNYTFWISSDNRSELWLSTDDKPINKIKIAYVSGATGSRKWDKYVTQKSTAINLVAGRKYYVEALHKEGTGYDNLAVGWQLPNGIFERPIPGNRLLSFGSQAPATIFQPTNTTAMQAEKLTSSRTNDNQNIMIFPNPVQSGVAELTISGYERIHGGTETRFEILRMTGEVIHVERIYCEKDCDPYLLHINKELTAGVYLVNIIINGKRVSKKLLVM